jgi:hypothetical protein
MRALLFIVYNRIRFRWAVVDANINSLAKRVIMPMGGIVASGTETDRRRRNGTGN